MHCQRASAQTHIASMTAKAKELVKDCGTVLRASMKETAARNQ